MVEWYNRCTRDSRPAKAGPVVRHVIGSLLPKREDRSHFFLGKETSVKEPGGSVRERSPIRSQDCTHSPQAGKCDRACESMVRAARTGASPLLPFISTDPLRSPQQAYAPASRCYAASSSSRVTPHGAGQARATGSVYSPSSLERPVEYRIWAARWVCMRASCQPTHRRGTGRHRRTCHPDDRRHRSGRSRRSLRQRSRHRK